MAAIIVIFFMIFGLFLFCNRRLHKGDKKPKKSKKKKRISGAAAEEP